MADDDNVIRLPVREPKDAGARAHRVAVDRLHLCWDLLEQENNGIDIDWSGYEVAAPFDGCHDCIVREVLHASVPIILNHFGVGP